MDIQICQSASDFDGHSRTVSLISVHHQEKIIAYGPTNYSDAMDVFLYRKTANFSFHTAISSFCIRFRFGNQFSIFWIILIVQSRGIDRNLLSDRATKETGYAFIRRLARNIPKGDIDRADCSSSKSCLLYTSDAADE